MKTLRERCIPTTTEMPVPIPTADGKGIAKTLMVTVNSITDPTTGEEGEAYSPQRRGERGEGNQ
jgi:hypothetical protein